MPKALAVAGGSLLLLLATGSSADDLTLPAVRRPDRLWRHRAAITLAGPRCPLAAREYERAVRRDGERVQDLRCLALKRLVGQSGDSREVAQRWTELEPGNPDAWLLRAIAASDVHAAREALWLRPDDPDAWNLLGTLCADGMRCARGTGEEAFRAAVRLRPAFPEAWLNLAAAARPYTPEGALELRHAARQAVKGMPDSADAWMFLGHSAFPGRGVVSENPAHWGEAAKAYAEAVWLDPQTPSRWSTLTTALRMARDPDLSARLRFRLSFVDRAQAQRLP